MTTQQQVTVGNDGLRAIETLGGVSMGGLVMGGDYRRAPRLIVMPVVAGASVNSVVLGNTVGIEMWFYDEDGNLFNPVDGLAEVRVENPRENGSTAAPTQDWTPADPRGAGHFLFSWQFSLTDIPGTWTFRVRGMTSAGDYLMADIRFLVARV